MDKTQMERRKMTNTERNLIIVFFLLQIIFATLFLSIYFSSSHYSGVGEDRKDISPKDEINEAIIILLNSSIVNKRKVDSTIYGIVGYPAHAVAIFRTDYIVDLQNGDNKILPYEIWNLAQKTDILIIWRYKNDWFFQKEHVAILRNGEKIFDE